MAEFSKESNCGLNDFSIKDIFDSLDECKYVAQICEHFGFVAIAKQEGLCRVAMPDKNDLDAAAHWHTFCFHTNKILPNRT